MLTIRKALLPLAGAGLLFAGAASADIDITVNNASGSVGGTVVITYDYAALDADDVAGYQFDLIYDPAMLTPTDISNCGNNIPASHNASCTEPDGAGNGTVRTVVADFVAPVEEIMPLAQASMGEFTFQIDAPGTHTLTFTNASGSDIDANAVTITGTDGEITGNIVGTSFYQSTPAVGDTVDFGSAVANTATAAQTITVDNISSDTDFDITAASGTSGGATIGATVVGGTPVTVPGDGAGGTTVDVDFECTPTARGAQSGTLDIDNDSDNEGPTASYNFDCAGLAPNVVMPPDVSMSGLTTDPTPLTETATVTNPEDGFTSTAENITVAAAGDAEISVAAGTLPDIPADGSEDITVECDNSAEGTFTSTITVEWDDPVSGGTATDTFEVTCEVSDAFPVYESNPAVGSLIDFGTVTNGDTSASMGIDVGNSAGQGPAPDSDLNITGATASDPAFTVTVVDPGPFAAGDAPDGTDDIEVTCSPTSVGVITATLNVETDDPAEPVGGFEYDLECEGVSDGAFDSTPPPGGTLNLGVVEPGGTSPVGEIVFENNGEQDVIDLNCTLTDPDGVFTMTPASPAAFTIDPGETDSAEFQCSPPTAESFSATLDCDVTGDPDVETAQYTILCQGQPLVIPTMSRWGLIALFAMLLVVGGFATRRLVSN